MHLWPTKNLRDSFKLSYLTNLEWNYRRMKRDQQQQQSSTQQKLLENENENENEKEDQNPNSLKSEPESVLFVSFCHEILLLLSCCYCCFCCGACVDEK